MELTSGRMNRIHFEKPVNNKRIENILYKKEQPYWTYHKVGKKYYVMTFEDNIYECSK